MSEFILTHLTWIIGGGVFLFVGAIILSFFVLRKPTKKVVTPVSAVPYQETPTKELETPQDNFFGLQLITEAGKLINLAQLPAGIGRAPQNQVVLSDDSISANHARIFEHTLSGAICIEDLRSLNGLFVNGFPTRKNILNDGDKLILGNTTLTFRNTGYIPAGSK